MTWKSGFAKSEKAEETVDQKDIIDAADEDLYKTPELPPEGRSGKVSHNPERSEISIWLVLAFIPFIYTMADSFQSDYGLFYYRTFLPIVIKSSILFLVIMIFPYFFRQIFGAYPITYLSKSTKNEPRTPQIVGRNIIVQAGGDASSKAIASGITPNPRALLEIHARNSADVAQKIYNRAGVYLMAGAIIAFAGLGIFYAIPYNDTSASSHDLVDRLFGLLPRFGVLFFIEFVAIFFLRQYRSAMDDYRYYDAVRRHREENLVVLHMYAESNIGPVATKDVLESMSIYSGVDSITKDQTSTTIELRKLDRDELIFFEKMVEGLSAIRKEKEEKSKRSKQDENKK